MAIICVKTANLRFYHWLKLGKAAQETLLLQLTSFPGLQQVHSPLSKVSTLLFMLEFIESNKKITWLAIVLLFTLLMLLLVRFIFHNINKRAEKRGSTNISTYRSISRTLNIFFGILGLGLASYTLFDGEKYELVNKNIERIIWIGCVAVSTLIAVALTKSYFRRKIAESLESDVQDSTTYKYLNSLATIFIYIVGVSLAAYAFPSLRFLAQSAMTGAGVVALVIGVASQEAISNLVSGAFIVVFKPFQIGHTVQIGSNIEGVVEDLTLRHTVIRDFQNRRIVIPNAIINKEYVTNFNMGETKVCEWLDVGISYDSDVDLAISIIREAAESHPLVIDNRTPEEIEEGKTIVEVRVVAWGDSSVNLRAYLWADSNDDGRLMRHQLLKSVKEKFDAQGIEIPFPHQVLIQKTVDGRR